MASQSAAAKTVFVAGALMVAILLSASIKQPSKFAGGKLYKQTWAIGVLTLFLAIAADVAPQLIVPFAVAVVVAYAVKNPGALGAILPGGQKAPPAPATSTHAGPAGIGGHY